MLRGDKWRKDERPDAATAATDGEKSVKIGAPRETFEGENRVAMTPDSVLALAKLGHSCVIETGAGAKAGFSDAAYAAAGVEVVETAAVLDQQGLRDGAGNPVRQLSPLVVQ